MDAVLTCSVINVVFIVCEITIKKMTEVDRYLSDIYFNPKHSASYSGVNKLYTFVKKDKKHKLSVKDIREWLSKQEGYSLQRHINRKFKRLKVVVSGIDNQWDLDTAVLINLVKENDGYNYFVLVIDIFSRYIWTRPLKRKLGKEMAEKLASIFEEGRTPDTMRVDKGGEYVNKNVKMLLKENNVKLVVTENEVKANFAERAIKTLKTKLTRYMTENNTHRWVDRLEDITKSYNDTFHNSIGMRPNDVNENNQAELWLKLYPNVPKKDKIKIKKEPKDKKMKNKLKTKMVFKFKVGDNVRITNTRRTFQKEYDERWTREYFSIIDRNLKENIPVYKLKDWGNEEINGIFYESELQKITVDGEKSYKIEKVLSKRIRKGKKEIFVRWLGWASKFDSWVDENYIKHI